MNPCSINAAYLPDGQGIAVGTRDHGVVFTDTQGVRTTHAPITLGSSRPTKLALRPTDIGSQWPGPMAPASRSTMSPVATLLDRFKDSAFALSPDGRWLALQEGSDIVLRPIASGEPRVVLGRHGGASAMTFSPDGALLAVAFLDAAAVLWDVAKREQFGALRGHHKRSSTWRSVRTASGSATGVYDYTTRIWETRTGQTSPHFPVPARHSGCGGLPRVNISRRASNNSREIFLYRDHGPAPRAAVADRPPSRTQVRGGSPASGTDRDFRLHGARTPGTSPLPAPPRSGWSPIPRRSLSVAYSPDGSLLATASWVMELPTLARASSSSGTGARARSGARISQPEHVSALAFDPTGERLACGDLAGHVVVWDLVTSRPVQRFATGCLRLVDRPS